MCGRLACTLGKKDLIKACGYKSSSGTPHYPNWVCPNTGKDYVPGYNIAPGSYTPVLTKASHLSKFSSDNPEEVLICPMRWGFVPSWHKGSLQEFQLSTNNCRIENILEKPTYKSAIKKGRRCVILADGYFEWQTKNNKKHPYFIYFPQASEDVMKKREWEKDENLLWQEEKGWVGPRLLTMAGLFDVWESPEGDFYSYSVLTMESSPQVSGIHHRMPAILDGPEAIAKWLDYDNVDFKEAYTDIIPNECLCFHAVNPVVNNSRNQGAECVLPYEGKPPPKPSGSSNLMMKWLKRPVPSTEESKPNKRQKT